jgi:2-desacetyl-2-hydroxyethyl bacteriochlorophyllide A dehydrogenase
MLKNHYYSAVIDAPGSVRLNKTKIKPPGPNEVRVRLQGCGVCGSNLPIWEGRPWFEYPLAAGAPGHEGWGIVDEIGSDVESIKAGSRVALLSYHAFGEVEVADVSSVVELPPSLDGMDFPGEALGCAMNVFDRADIKPGQTVAIIGSGFLGSLLVELASVAGATVIAVSRRESSLKAAQRMGASHVIPLNDHLEILHEIGRITSGRYCERVIEATGMQWPLDLAGELCAERGKLIIAGYHQDGLRQVNMQLWNWRGLDVINAHERDSRCYINGMKRAIDAIEQGQLNPSELYTHHFQLGDLSTALNLLGSRDEGFMKAIITYD